MCAWVFEVLAERLVSLVKRLMCIRIVSFARCAHEVETETLPS